MFEGSKLDTFFICLLIIAISMIFGMNIISLIDKKISNVSINIPPIKVPSPSIVVNIHKSNGKVNTISNKNLTEEVDSNDVKEHFSSVSEEDNIKVDIKNNTSNKINSSETNTNDIEIESEKHLSEPIDLKNPPSENIIEYNEFQNNNQRNTTNYTVGGNTKSSNLSTKKVHCENPSINKKFQKGKNAIAQNKTHSCKNKYKPESFYRYYTAPIAYLEDYKLKGANYGDYNNYLPPRDAGVRLLPKDNKNLYPKHSKFDKIPKAVNYIF